MPILRPRRPNAASPAAVTSKLLGRIEWAFVSTVTLLAIGLHLVWMRNAGALWRDEVNSVELAALPTLRDVWQNLQYDGFPMLWFLLLRGWARLGATGDLGHRVLGCLVGVSLVAALWWSARQFPSRIPFWSLALFALHPVVLRYGDSMRGYGLGIVLFVLAFALIWRAASATTALRIALATGIAIASVQAYYQNAVFVFATCTAGALVCLRRGRRDHAALLLGVGGAAALSLLPYVTVFERGREWNVLNQLPEFGFAWFVSRLTEAMGSGTSWIWLSLCIATAGFGILRQMRSPGVRLASETVDPISAAPLERDAELYATATLAIGAAGFYVFLNTLRYPTQSWYYAVLLALMAVTADVVLTNARASSWRIARLILASAVVLHGVQRSWPELHVRHTNVDAIAGIITQRTSKEDFVLVRSWYEGITFQRYYRGETPWMTLPPMPLPKLHRYDLVKRQMENPEDTVRPVLEMMREALRSGHRVWLVGGLPFPRPGQPPPTLPPAPNGPNGWSEAFYYAGWALQAGSWLQVHATTLEEVDPGAMHPVHPFEAERLFVVSGWRGE